jgi:hypothetical protein
VAQRLLQERRGDRRRARRRAEEEYKAIVDAGFILQLDDAFLAHEYDRLRGLTSEREVHKYAERCVDLTNYALSRHSRGQGRYHVCWGSWNAPHTPTCRSRTLSDLILKVQAQAYSLESANPRHEHEWMVWKDVKLPDGKILIPGIVTHSTNVVEHPDLVAWRIKNFASVVGRENVIAGTDCGFAQSYNIVRCHPSVQWAQARALVEGARIASIGVVGALEHFRKSGLPVFRRNATTKKVSAKRPQPSLGRAGVDRRLQRRGAERGGSAIRWCALYKVVPARARGRASGSAPHRLGGIPGHARRRRRA